MRFTREMIIAMRKSSKMLDGLSRVQDIIVPDAQDPVCFTTLEPEQVCYSRKSALRWLTAVIFDRLFKSGRKLIERTPNLAIQPIDPVLLVRTISSSYHGNSY